MRGLVRLQSSSQADHPMLFVMAGMRSDNMKHLALFIEPTAAQLNIFSAFTLPRLGSFILAGLVNLRPSWRARVFIEGRKLFNLQTWMAEHGRPALVGISTITATAK